MTLYDVLIRRKNAGTLVPDLAVLLAGITLMTVAARVQVPFYPVPMSMQSLVAIGLGLALGPARGAAAVAAYLALGAAGLPVFAGTPQQGLGIAYMAGPTGGYLIGFVLAAAVAGFFAPAAWSRNVVLSMTAALVAAAVVYIPGLLWLGLYLGYNEQLLAAGLLPFVAGDVAKALLAAIAFPAAWRFLHSEERP